MTGITSAAVTSRPSSRVREVTPASAMPQGTKRSYQLEVDVAVDGEAVHRDAAADPDADRGDLALGADRSSARSHTPLRPGTRAVVTPKSRAGRDQRLLDAADVVDDLDVVGQRDDRVADQLAGAVEGDLAAAVDVDDRGATGVERPLVRLGALAAGEDRRVLEQQHGVVGVAGDHRRVDLALEVPGGEVVDGVGARARRCGSRATARAYPRGRGPVGCRPSRAGHWPAGST